MDNLEYRIREYCGEFDIQVKSIVTDWTCCDIDGGVYGFRQMPSFNTKKAAEKELKLIIEGPKYHYVDIPEIVALTDNEKNGLIHEMGKEKASLQGRIDKFNELNWWSKIWTGKI